MIKKTFLKYCPSPGTKSKRRHQSKLTQRQIDIRARRSANDRKVEEKSQTKETPHREEYQPTKAAQYVPLSFWAVPQTSHYAACNATPAQRKFFNYSTPNINHPARSTSTAHGHIYKTYHRWNPRNTWRNSKTIWKSTFHWTRILVLRTSCSHRRSARWRSCRWRGWTWRGGSWEWRSTIEWF